MIIVYSLVDPEEYNNDSSAWNKLFSENKGEVLKVRGVGDRFWILAKFPGNTLPSTSYFQWLDAPKEEVTDAADVLSEEELKSGIVSPFWEEADRIAKEIEEGAKKTVSSIGRVGLGIGGMVAGVAVLVLLASLIRKR